MSLVNERQKTYHVPMPVMCWRCDAPMTVKTIAPAMLSSSLDEVVYSCPGCHDETMQTVLRD